MNSQQLERYARHLQLPGFGECAQQRLLDSTVLVVGAGGLGCPALMYLAAAGVGRIILLDDDRVERSNLQRQILFEESDVGHLKVDVARKKLGQLNADLKVEAHAIRLRADTARSWVRQADLVLDGTDTFSSRYPINDACVLEGRPLAFGCVQGWQGQSALLIDHGAPCYRCLHPEPPAPHLAPNCTQNGILGVVPGLVGVQQAALAIRFLANLDRPSGTRLQWTDLALGEAGTITLKRRPDCAVCGTDPTIREPSDPESGTCARTDWEEVPPNDLSTWKTRHPEGRLIDVREAEELLQLPFPDAEHFPLSSVETWIDTLDARVPTLFVCQSGIRSRQVCDWLASGNHACMANLTGGLKAWLRWESLGKRDG